MTSELKFRLQDLYHLKVQILYHLQLAAKRAWYKINFSGFQLYINEVTTNSDYRICTCSILYGLVSNPALPPESLGQNDSVQMTHRPPKDLEVPKSLGACHLECTGDTGEKAKSTQNYEFYQFTKSGRM